MAEKTKIDDVEVVDEERDTKVVVVEAKEGIGMKVKKHWKKIAIAGAAVAAIAAVIGVFWLMWPSIQGSLNAQWNNITAGGAMVVVEK